MDGVGSVEEIDGIQSEAGAGSAIREIIHGLPGANLDNNEI